MNLTSLFNFKYLMQNIKKSKGLISLLMLLVPMFTSIMLLSIDSDTVISFVELSAVNIIFMYIIPIVLSMTLFSYVYKKNSVDFIGSMPLSRKTIFLTNTIGGMAIIAIMQLLTMISTFFLSNVISGITIFGSMVWDIFIFYTVAYIFVFAVSNLAMSFSGNKFSQLVAICLILFLVPFLVMSGDLFGDEYSYIGIEDVMQTIGSEEGEKIRVEVPYHFTAPNYIFGIICNNDSYEYSTESVLKMVTLSVIYTGIGLMIFRKKKLEMAGESYENVKTHLVIKMLTFVPFMFVYCSLTNSNRQSVFLFFVAILAVYYFLFDLITNKKIKLKVSIPAFIISALIVFAVYEGIIPRWGRNNDKIINIEEVQSVCIDSIEKRYNENCDFDLLIEDKNLIQLILREVDNVGRYYNYIYEEDKIYDDSEGVNTIVAEESNEISYIEPEGIQIDKEIIELENNGYMSANANLIIKLNNGKTYNYEKYLDRGIYETIMNTLETKKVEKNFEEMVPCLEGMTLTKKEKEEIIEIISKEVNDLTYKDLYDSYYGEEVEYKLYLYEYRNHELICNSYVTKKFQKLFNKMANLSNQKAIQVHLKARWYDFYDTTELIKMMQERNPGKFESYTKKDNSFLETMLYDAINSNSSILYEFMRTEAQKPVDITKKYIVIRSYYPSYFYTNNLEGVYEMIINNYNENNEYDLKFNN